MKGAKYGMGTSRSVMKLDTLGFDPITELVKVYRKLELELEFQEQLRMGNVNMLNAKGKQINYSAIVHDTIYDKLIKVGEALLRYKYGRVPETEQLEGKERSSLTINLNNNRGQRVLNSGEINEIISGKLPVQGG